MKLGPLGPKFKTDYIATLWECRIIDLDTLKARLPGCVLIILDVRSSPEGVSEIGFAVLGVSENAPQFCRSLQSFYDQNKS